MNATSKRQLYDARPMLRRNAIARSPGPNVDRQSIDLWKSRHFSGSSKTSDQRGMINNVIKHSASLPSVAGVGNMICSDTICNDLAMDANEMEPHERLRYARQRAGFASQADFAKKVGIVDTTYRAYESGQNAFAKLAPTFAKHLSVSTDWLLSGGDTPPIHEVRSQLWPGRSPDNPPIVPADRDGAINVRRVDLSYAMGDGANIDDYPEEDSVQFDANFLRTISRAPAHSLFVARGDGDSMFPTLINDDQVLIDTSQRRVNMQDRIWACAVHGAGMIKRLRVIDSETIEVRSDNPAVGNREVSVADLNIVGRVIYIGRRL